MTATPPGLAIHWSPVGAELTCHPLRRSPRTHLLPRVAAKTGALMVAVSLAMVPVRLLDIVPLGLPPLALASCAAAALMFELLAAVRRDRSVMRLRIRPGSLEVEHRLLGVHLVTEAIDLDRVRRFELDDAARLVVSMRDAPARYEPLHGLEPEARKFVADLLEDARQSGDRFARARVGDAGAADAVARLADLSRSR